jgi:putative ABC transport system ATP-binding protein
MGSEEVRALDGVSFDIRQGELVAIMGPSGSGKSTLMNLIGALDQPTTGELEVAGKRLGALSPDELADLRAHAVGFVFQQFQLLPRLSALDNVAMPLLYRRDFAGDPRAAARARLEQVGLGARTGHRPSEMSGGQQQRVAIARALVGEPSLLLADEPTGALDSRTGAAVIALFQSLNAAGQTIVLVTHDTEVARAATRVLRMRDGRIVADEPVAPADRWLPQPEGT